MRTLLVACGNRLRHDDGVAHTALELLGSHAACETRAVLQLTPELAEEIAGFDQVVFLDADPNAVSPHVELLSAQAPVAALTHISHPAEIVALARVLYGFTGDARLCRIPAPDLSPGEGLSPAAKDFARQAADCLVAALA
jgi:hydrogenase maturation protease